MLAPMGIGVLYARRALLEEMPPFLTGGEMVREVWLERATWDDPPLKFEAGTPNVAGAVGLAAAIDYLTAIGMESIAEHGAADNRSPRPGPPRRPRSASRPRTSRRVVPTRALRPTLRTISPPVRNGGIASSSARLP